MFILRVLILIIFAYAMGNAASFAVNLFLKQKTNPPVELGFPVFCNPGEDCWIINYPDLAPYGKIKDYKNGKITYDSNKGTSIAVRTVMDIKKGIPVISAADGEVISVRNDFEDNYLLKDSVKGEPQTFCGNSIVIKHNNNWKTIYCHLKKDSIKVNAGDFARKATQIAEIGLSGKTRFPHLYFAVFHNDSYFDPFSGSELAEKEERQVYKPFWDSLVKENLTYKSIIITNIGVSTEKPELIDAKMGIYSDAKVFSDASAIFLWVYGFHFDKNDLIKISIKNPLQEVVLEDFKHPDSNKTEQLIFFKKPKDSDKWVIGLYNVSMEVIDPGANIVYDYNFDFEVKKDPESIKQEAAREKERLRKLRLKRRKVIIFKKLKEEGKLPDSYKENKFKIKD